MPFGDLSFFVCIDIIYLHLIFVAIGNTSVNTNIMYSIGKRDEVVNPVHSRSNFAEIVGLDNGSQVRNYSIQLNNTNIEILY